MGGILMSTGLRFKHDLEGYTVQWNTGAGR